jgi:hypothetical protein
MQTLSPELRLAAACAKWPPNDDRTQAMRRAAAAPLDWKHFIRIAKRHQVIGLVHDGLMRLEACAPSDTIEEIADESAVLVRDNLGIARESIRLQHLFHEAGLPVLFLKGTALSLLAFGDVGLRTAQDIDLWVPYETLQSATALLLNAGYHRFDPPLNVTDSQMLMLMSLRKDLGFISAKTGVQVELHWRLFLNPHAMNEESIMTNSQLVPLSGSAGLCTLNEEDLFTYLCLHGALHWWNRLKWLADINALLACKRGHAMERLVNAAERKGAGRAVAQALLLCQSVFQTPLPEALAAKLSKGKAAPWLVATAISAITKGDGAYDPHETRVGTTRGSLSTFLLSPSWRYRLSELRVQMTNPTDILDVPLPEWLWFLYPVLRIPLWAWRHIMQHRTKRR